MHGRQHVVLPQGLDPHHVTLHGHRRQQWEQWEGLVLVLVLVHLVALAFWASLLYSTREQRRAKRGDAAAGRDSSRVAGAAAQPQRWRTPRDVLLSAQKARLGKV